MVLALDLSGSMGQEEAGGGTRLGKAKAEITRFVDSRPNDVIGLVTFGEQALTRVPPTTDHRHLLQVIQNLEVASSDEGTALGMGVGLASFTVKEVPLPSRVVVVLSDGRGNRGSVDPDSAAQAGNTLGVTVHTVGLGDRSGPDPLDEEALRSVSREGGGRFYRSDDTEGLGEVLEEIRGMEQQAHPTPGLRSATPLHRPLLWMAWGLLFIEALAAGFPWRVES
jgi:Ca-activated chloride channel family protein